MLTCTTRKSWRRMLVSSARQVASWSIVASQPEAAAQPDALDLWIALNDRIAEVSVVGGVDADAPIGVLGAQSITFRVAF